MTKSELKFYSSLKQKKNRDKNRQFLIEGKKIIAEALESEYKIFRIFITNKFSESEKQFLNDISNNGITPEFITASEMKKISDTNSPPGIAAVIRIEEPKPPDYSETVIGLYKINDPGNLGTIIRSCDWFGYKNILISEDCVDLYNPKVIRSSMGSVFHCKIKNASNFENELFRLKSEGKKIYCADIKGENLFNSELDRNSVIIFSSESHGPSDKITLLSDSVFSIPKYGDAESLNVAVSAAVTLAELRKQ